MSELISSRPVDRCVRPVLAAACAVGVTLSGGVAQAHDPQEMGGTPLTNPFGHNFWFFANYQTAQNPFSPANTHVTSSDIAFWGDLAYVGDYGGFRIFDISQPIPKESRTSAATGRRATRRCSTATTTATPTRSCSPSTAC